MLYTNRTNEQFCDATTFHRKDPPEIIITIYFFVIVLTENSGLAINETPVFLTDEIIVVIRFSIIM